MLKDQAQQAVVDLYFEKNLLRACGVLSTGFGKSKIAIDIIKRLDPPQVLILVNSTHLRDYSWKKEFEKWGELALWESKVRIVTYQKAYRWKSKYYSLDDTFVIADEVDFAANTGELSKFFYEYPDLKLLGLTGFITSTKINWFSKYMPIFTQFTAAQAQEARILNNIHYVFVKFDMSLDPGDIKVDYRHKASGKKKFFHQSESLAYDFANKKVRAALAEGAQIRVEAMTGVISHEEATHREKSLGYAIKQYTATRNDLLLHSKATRDLAKRLISYIDSTPGNKTLVFSKRTKQSIAICGKDAVFNGAISKSKAAKNYENFEQGLITTLGVCDKVNRGANIMGLNTSVFETFFGSDTKATQRFGRQMRLNPNEWATAYVLLPYYMRKEEDGKFTVQETQQVIWARNMLRSTKVKSSTVWDYRAIKTE